MPLLLTNGFATAQRIEFLDRFGRNLNKVNYVKRLDGMLLKYHEVDCTKKFIQAVKHLYTFEQDFPRIHVFFAGDEGEFERIKDKYNKRYLERGVVLRLTSQDVLVLLRK
jgi:hypothetical protein